MLNKTTLQNFTKNYLINKRDRSGIIRKIDSLSPKDNNKIPLMKEMKKCD